MNTELTHLEDLKDRLRDHVQEKIDRRELTASRLASQAGIRQGHLSNFLNQRRGLSLGSMDRLLDELGLGALGLISAQELTRWFARPAPRSRFDVVPRVAVSCALTPVLPKSSVLASHTVEKSLLRRFRSNDVAGRITWQRFVFLEVSAGEVRSILPTAKKRATLLVDRLHTALEPCRRSRLNLYLVKTDRMLVGKVKLLNDGNAIVQPCDGKCEILTLPLTPETHYWDYIVGRVCQIRTEP